MASKCLGELMLRPSSIARMPHAHMGKQTWPWICHRGFSHTPTRPAQSTRNDGDDQSYASEGESKRPIVRYISDQAAKEAQSQPQTQSQPTQDEVAFVNLATGEDELADIPAEMREVVAAEIAAFRDRSNQRDRDRLRREEELEAEERRRSGRRATPPSSAPSGPGNANGVPLGPRAERGVQGAPSGPKGSQFPRDYQAGVNFVNGGAVNNGVYISREDDDDSASDSELERRRQKKRNDEAEEAYKKQLHRWLNTERRTVASLDRTNDYFKNMDAEREKARVAQAKQLREFDDDQEAASRRDLYYRDHSDWIREREKVRGLEAKEDAIDRDQERREMAAQKRQQDHARGQADAFLEEQGEELMRREEQREPAHFKISLGAAAKKLEQTAAPRRTAADVENLLEDEDLTDQPGSKKRTLIPINFDAAVRANLTQEEIEEAQRQLARDIPNDKEGLWNWAVSWEHLPEKNINKDIKEWAANKVLEIMGVQEEMLVDAIVEHLKSRGAPQPLVENLEVVSVLVPSMLVYFVANSQPRPLMRKQKLWSRSFGVWSSTTVRLKRGGLSRLLAYASKVALSFKVRYCRMLN